MELDGKSWLINSTGVNELAEDKNISVFPNPVEGELTVSGLKFAAAKQMSIELFSMDGKKVFSTVPVSENISINTESFAKGIYLLKAGKVSKKIVIE